MVHATSETDGPPNGQPGSEEARITQLICRILHVSPSIATGGGRDITYGVFDGEELVATGVSSSPEWARHDAGGYHTKAKFDKRYPEGWNVNFDF